MRRDRKQNVDLSHKKVYILQIMETRNICEDVLQKSKENNSDYELFLRDYNELANTGNVSLDVYDDFDNSTSEVCILVLESAKGSFLGITAQYVLICVYIMLIVFGTIGNAIVALVIACKKELRTARNLYIINLTLSDVSMCYVCMPFTLIGLLKKNWTLGSCICKLVPVIQCTNILVSTATVVAIAVDRFVSIVSRSRHNSGKNCSKTCTFFIIVSIWIISLLFTLPLLSNYYVEKVYFRNIFLYNRCSESWTYTKFKNGWIVILIIIQYIIPVVVIAFIHLKIRQVISRHVCTLKNAMRTKKEAERNKRTTVLLASVATTFAVSWFPWHIVNIMADFSYSGFNNPEYFYAVFGSCHAISMTTACTNPILYGWLNTNLRKEIRDALRRTAIKFSPGRTTNNSKCKDRIDVPLPSPIRIRIRGAEDTFI